MFDSEILLYVLIVWFVILFLMAIKRLFEIKSWIITKSKKGIFDEIGFLKYNEGEASEVFISGGNTSVPVGRVIIGEGRDENAYIEILNSSYEESSASPSYRSCGYISPEGFIYKRMKKNGRPERIGYTARPSAHNTPTSIGERSWKTLWLKCTLYAYLGKPELVLPDSGENDNKEKQAKQSSQIASFKAINSSAGESDEGKMKSNPVSDITEEGSIEHQTPNGELATFLSEESKPLEENSNLTETVPLTDDGTVFTAEENSSNAEGGLSATRETAEEAPSAEVETDNKQDTDSDTEPEEASTTENTEEGHDDNAATNRTPETTNTSTPADTNEQEGENAGATVPPPIVPDEKEKNDSEDSKKKDSKDKKKSDKKGNVRAPYAISYHWGFHNSKRDALSPESRGCAYALFFNLYNKNNYSEYYKNRPYGWFDTALLTSFIYSIIFLIGFALVRFVWKKDFIGDSDELAIEFSVLYFLLWALIRQIKIYRIETSNTIQPYIDLFNKSLGQGFFDWSMIVLCVLALAYIGNYYETYDWVPLILAILFGTIFNMFCKPAHEKWIIKNSLYDNDDILDDEIINPDGDISRSYDWDLDSRVSETQLHGNLTLYFTADTITDIRQVNPFFAQIKEKSDKDYILEMFHFMKEHKSMMARVKYISYSIEKLCDKHSLHQLDRIQFVLDFVQEPNIKFIMNKESEAVNKYHDYIRYPDETLFDKEGDSNSKALLAAMLFNQMKYNVLYMHSRAQEHAALGVEIRPEWMELLGAKKTVDEMTVDYNGKKYIFCETTGDKFRIVEVMEGMHYDDFEERIELPVLEDDVDDNNLSDTQESRIYNWDLDSVYGSQLHGSYTLEFNQSDIKELRDLNPFNKYGENNNSYEQNIRSIFEFTRQDGNSDKIKEIVRYIKNSIDDAKLQELDLVQFVLDFAQAPNINYCIDENSASIGFAKEYMRFPDEVLYDKEGDCDCKSSLTAALFHELGYNVIIMLSEKIGHAAIGVELKEEWLKDIKVEEEERVVREYNGKRYLYCETTGDGYKIGHIKEGDSIQDFETIIELSI